VTTVETGPNRRDVPISLFAVALVKRGMMPARRPQDLRH